MYRYFVFIFVFFIESCSLADKHKRKEHLEHAKLDGRILFREKCITCHHFSAYKEGFQWPSLQEVKQSDSINRLAFTRKFANDTFHVFVRSKLNKEELDALLAFINAVN